MAKTRAPFPAKSIGTIDVAELPRSDAGDGTDLSILTRGSEGVVTISDGERWAVYKPMEGHEPLSSELRILPQYVEGRWFSEATVVKLSDGVNASLYVPRDEVTFDTGA